MVAASLASSAVVNAITRFTQFDEQVARSAGAKCAEMLRQTTYEVESALPGVKARFGEDARFMLDSDFMFLVADIMAESVQYGHRTELCKHMTAMPTQPTSLTDMFVNYTLGFFSRTLVGQNESLAAGYDRVQLANQSAANPQANMRCWWWQTCTEFGWFQIAPEKRASIRSQRVNMDWHRDFCRGTFGMEFDTEQAVRDTNTHFGGAQIAGSQILFTNGIEDPWQWASRRIMSRVGSDANMAAELIDCVDCGHCVDLHTPRAADPLALSKSRDRITRTIVEWVESYVPPIACSRSA